MHLLALGPGVPPVRRSSGSVDPPGSFDPEHPELRKFHRVQRGSAVFQNQEGNFASGEQDDTIFRHLPIQ